MRQQQQQTLYRRIRCIGKGSYGTVYLAEDAEGRRCALKQVHLHGTPQDGEGALREVRLLRRLRHPYIIRYKDAFLEGSEYLCICMEYGTGGDLSSRIKQQQKAGWLFPQAKALDWIAQLAMGLVYLHDRNILHRDLKTQNIFLSARDHVKLGDFGIAVQLATAGMAQTLVGTPYYIAPEIWKGLPYDHKSDCWSMGVVLYEILSLGHRPFAARSISALAVQIMGGCYLPPPSSYDDAVTELVAALLTQNPARRLGARDMLTQPQLAVQAAKYARGLVAVPAVRDVKANAEQPQVAIKETRADEWERRARSPEALPSRPEPHAAACNPPEHQPVLVSQQQLGADKPARRLPAVPKAVDGALLMQEPSAEIIVPTHFGVQPAKHDGERQQGPSVAAEAAPTVPAAAPEESRTSATSTSPASGSSNPKERAACRWQVEHAKFVVAATLGDQWRTLVLPVEAGDGVFTRMEALRVMLEEKIGAERLQEVYAALVEELAMAQCEEETRRGLRRVRHLLPAADHGALPLLVQLAHCDAYYFDRIG